MAKAYSALPKKGVLIVIESFIDDSRRVVPHSLLASLNMLIQTEGGSEFTARECMTWMREAGFNATNIIPLTGAQAAVIGIRDTEA